MPRHRELERFFEKAHDRLDKELSPVFSKAVQVFLGQPPGIIFSHYRDLFRDTKSVLGTRKGGALEPPDPGAAARSFTSWFSESEILQTLDSLIGIEESFVSSPEALQSLTWNRWLSYFNGNVKKPFLLSPSTAPTSKLLLLRNMFSRIPPVPHDTEKF